MDSAMGQIPKYHSPQNVFLVFVMLLYVWRKMYAAEVNFLYGWRKLLFSWETAEGCVSCSYSHIYVELSVTVMNDVSLPRSVCLVPGSFYCIFVVDTLTWYFICMWNRLNYFTGRKTCRADCCYVDLWCHFHAGGATHCTSQDKPWHVWVLLSGQVSHWLVLGLKCI